MATICEQSEDEGRIALAEDAPPVNLELLIVENKYGLELSSHPIMGRVIVVTKDDLWNDPTLLYQPILKERPALVCQQQDYMDFMEVFLSSPEDIQVGLLDMYYQPLDSSMGKALVEPAKILYLLGVLDDFLLIHQLLSILMTNGHQYQETKSAIPLFGSKFSHSCNPNVGYSSLASADGSMHYLLLRPVRKGELVCFSYLADLLDTPTCERRELLMETKSFWCKCERCEGPDYCRSIQCPTCPKKLPCRYDSYTAEPFWECGNCGMLERLSILQLERVYTQALKVIESSIQGRKDFNKRSEYRPFILKDLWVECCQRLAPNHHLTLKTLRCWMTLATSDAFVQIKQRMIRGLSMDHTIIHSMFHSSIIAGFHFVLAGECVAANCTGCVTTKVTEDDEDGSTFATTTTSTTASVMTSPVFIRHQPNYDRSVPMKHICDNLLLLPVHWWPPYAVTMTIRYLAILKAKFGEAPIQEIEKCIVLAWQDVTCLECGKNDYPVSFLLYGRREPE